MNKNEFTPFVYWAQTESNIGLRVDLQDVKAPRIEFTEDEVKFNAAGLGARGFHDYQFTLQFFLSIDPKKCSYKVLDREIEITVVKEKPQWWPRLIADQKKPVWLKIDFDKWKAEDEDDDIRPSTIDQQIKDIYNPKREEEMQDEAYKKVYMFMYNMFMFGGFGCIVLILLFFAVKDRQKSFKEAYANVGGLVIFFQLFQLFEILFAAIGWSKAKSLLPIYFQVGGRLFMLFGMIMAEPRIQKEPIVFYLFMVWCGAELFRYPYYFLDLFDIKVNIVTWFRYTMWIPLYPMGFFCEALIIFKNIPYFEETKMFSYPLPNFLNWSVDLPSIMRFYLLFLCFPLMVQQMTHMYRQRRMKIGKRKVKSKKE